MSLAAAERIQAMLAALPLEERREVKGSIPTARRRSWPGVTILVESIRAFGLDEIEVSEADILHGAALGGRRRHLKKNRPHHAGDSQNGPIRTGRGTCHERALRFGRREAPIRCGFARTYVPDEARRVCRTDTLHPAPTL